MIYNLNDHDFGGGHWVEDKQLHYKEIINEAIIFAMDKHSKQFRKYTGEPYWVHLAQVAGLVTSVTTDPKIIAIAWLHDILEDTDTSFSEISGQFGAKVACGVSFLSDAEDGNRITRKELSRKRLATAPDYIQNIKVCDLISNTSSIVLHDPKFAKVYLEEKRLLLECLSKADKRLLNLAYNQIK